MTHGIDQDRPGNVVSLLPNGRAPAAAFVAMNGVGAPHARPSSDPAWDAAAMMRSVVGAGQDAVEVLDLSEALLFASGAAMGFHGDRLEADEAWSLTWPGDARAAVTEAVATARTGAAARFCEWRQTARGESRWLDVVVSRMLADDGAPIGFLALSRDMTEIKSANDALDLRSRELSHRLKNVFALVIGLVTLSARDAPAVQPYAKTLRDRFGALSRALDYLQAPAPGSLGAQPAQSFQGLMRALLEPYDMASDGASRFRFLGSDDAPIGCGSVTSVALVIHELATNAVKYGALSEQAGFVSVDCRRVGDDLTVTWDERGGPAIEQPPERAGFGSTLTRRSVSGQLGGEIAQDWRRDGVTITLRMAIVCLAT